MANIPPGYHWVSDTEYKKAIGQVRLQLNGVFRPFRQYGQDIYILPAIEQIIELTEAFGQRVRGKDKPIISKKLRGV